MSLFSKVYIESFATTFKDSVSEAMCLVCFTSNKAIKNIHENNLEIFLLEVADIDVSECEGWLCFGCEALLYKCVRFRRKMRRRHRIRQEYRTNREIPSEVLEEELSIPMSPTMKQTRVLWISCTDSVSTDLQIFSNNDAINEPSSERLPIFNETIEKKNEITLPIEEELRDSVQNDSPEPVDFVCDDDHSVKEDDENKEKSSQRQNKTNRKCRKCREKNLESNNLKHENGSPTSDEDDNMSLSFYKKHDGPIPLRNDETTIKSIVLTKQQYTIEQQSKLSSEAFLRFPFRCSNCVKGFNFKEKLEKHMKLHDEKLGPFECSICSMRFSIQSLMENHKRQHGVRFECQKCEYTSAIKFCALRHYRTRHEGAPPPALACKYCQKIYRRARSLLLHEESHVSKNIAPCEICGKTYTNEASLLNHRLMHTAPKDLFTCEVCGKGFAVRRQLSMHKISHKKATGQFYCVDCDKFFKREGILKAHLSMSSKHVTGDHKKYKCDQCDRIFQFPLSLRNHIVFFHTDEKKYSCKFCKGVYVTASGLLRHVRVKHDKTPLPRSHVCDACGKGFKEKFILEEHLRIHTGEKPFKCGECGKSFRQNATMRTHVKLVHQKLKRSKKKEK